MANPKYGNLELSKRHCQSEDLQVFDIVALPIPVVLPTAINQLCHFQRKQGDDKQKNIQEKISKGKLEVFSFFLQVRRKRIEHILPFSVIDCM